MLALGALVRPRSGSPLKGSDLCRRPMFRLVRPLSSPSSLVPPPPTLALLGPAGRRPSPALAQSRSPA
eukprot:12264625-Heterocapsa_arctica.AAC.1